ncbi:unnamed protein product [Bursaphelenchus xylophilus]|uniref:(pine wood nematode) hypothetical protein n=1 Tax=Bursaphelenchus xylophilus TaxID=6326 RepID=A0A1I7RUM1_BURXY|nr:unnamed protein product [Bursaphelenchus xylophilus]CAG9114215.1 unnamed protein product [Bursaphelenchus xylophilus]
MTSHGSRESGSNNVPPRRKLTLNTMNDMELFYFRELYLIDPNRFRHPSNAPALVFDDFKPLNITPVSSDGALDDTLDSLEYEMSMANLEVEKSRATFQFDTDYDLPIHGNFSIVIGDDWPEGVDAQNNRVFGFRTPGEALEKLKNVETFSRCSIFLQRALYDKRRTPHDHYFEYVEGEQERDSEFYRKERRNLEALIDMLRIASAHGVIVIIQFPLELDDRRQPFSLYNIRLMCAYYRHSAHLFEYVYGAKGEITEQDEIDENMRKAIKKVLSIPIKTLKVMATALAAVICEYGTQEQFARRLRHHNLTKKELLTQKVLSVKPPGGADADVNFYESKPTKTPSDHGCRQSIPAPTTSPPHGRTRSPAPRCNETTAFISPSSSDHSNSSRKRQHSGQENGPPRIMTFGSQNWDKPQEREVKPDYDIRYDEEQVVKIENPELPYQPYPLPRVPYQPPIQPNPNPYVYSRPHVSSNDLYHQSHTRTYTEMPHSEAVPSLYPPNQEYGQRTLPNYSHSNAGDPYQRHAPQKQTSQSYLPQRRASQPYLPQQQSSQAYQNSDYLIPLIPPPPPPTPPHENKFPPLMDTKLRPMNNNTGRGIFHRPKYEPSSTYQPQYFRHSAFQYR